MVSAPTGTTGKYDCIPRSPRPTYGLGGGTESPMEPFSSHGEMTEGITVEGEESVDTKKYAVDGIPREYKRSMVSGANFSLAHPPTLNFLPPNTRHPVWRILVNFTSPNSEKW